MIETMQDYDLGPTLGEGHEETLRHVLDLKPEGTALEFGVGEGRTLRIIADRMPVIGFDSFNGLPEDWRDGYPAGYFACEPPEVDNATLMIGLFDETLPTFTHESVGLVHVDCDLYSSTKTVLQHTKPLLRPGTYIVFDEWHGYEGCEQHEQRAWREFVAETATNWRVIGHSVQQWGIQIV